MTFWLLEQEEYILARTLVGLPWEGCPIGAVQMPLNLFDPLPLESLIAKTLKAKESVLPGIPHAF